MLDKLGGAESALKAAIDDLRRSGGGALLAQSETELAALARLRADIGSAGPVALAAMQAVVGAAVAKAQSSAEQAHVAAEAAQTAQAQELASSAAQSREQVTGIMRDMQHLESGVRFGSPEEEGEYRRREAERRRYIADEQAKHTPEGDLNAANAAVGQMADAKVHGAGADPEFQKRWDDLLATTARLRSAVQASGQSTAESDTLLRSDLRRVLRSQGLSDADINARLAVHADNPLDAAREVKSVGQDASNKANQSAAPKAEAPSIPDIAAALKAAGVGTEATSSKPASGHGLAIADTPTVERTSIA